MFRVQWNSMAGYPGFQSDSSPVNEILFQIKGQIQRSPIEYVLYMIKVYYKLYES